MKKTVLAFALLGSLAFTGCEQEEEVAFTPENPLEQQLIGHWQVSTEYSKDYQETYGAEGDFTAIWANHFVKTLVLSADKTYSVIGPDGKKVPGGVWALTPENVLTFVSASEAGVSKEFQASLSTEGKLQLEDEHVRISHLKQ